MGYAAWLAKCYHRMQRRKLSEDGWEPVATEGDEPIEMLEGRTWLSILVMASIQTHNSTDIFLLRITAKFTN